MIAVILTSEVSVMLVRDTLSSAGQASGQTL
jgi:hypothetical protein